MDVPKHYGGFEVVLKHVQPLLQVLSKLTIQRQFLRTFSRTGEINLFLAGLGEGPPGPLFAQLHQGGVGGDAIQPSTDPRLATAPLEVAVCGQESVPAAPSASAWFPRIL